MRACVGMNAPYGNVAGKAPIAIRSNRTTITTTTNHKNKVKI